MALGMWKRGNDETRPGRPLRAAPARPRSHACPFPPAYLRTRPRGRGRTAAFTLIEMLVSLAVLSLALTVVGLVFTATTKTANQSAAYSEAHNWVRQFMEQMEQDLRFCEPSRSILVLVGRKQTAALTEADRQAGLHYRVLIGNPEWVPAGYDPKLAPLEDPDGHYSDPRADQILFFTDRPATSSAPPPNAPLDPVANNVKSAPLLVVYGHAAQGTPVWSGTNYVFPADDQIRHIETLPGYGADPNSPIPASQWHLSRRATLLEPSPGDLDITQAPGDPAFRLKSGLANPRLRLAGDVVPFDVELFLSGFEPDPLNNWAGPAIASPYFVDGPGWNEIPPNWTWQGLPMVEAIRKLLYVGTMWAWHHTATVLTQVPVDLKGNLGLHLLPGCAWFHVEFLMPEDPRNSFAYSNPDPLEVHPEPPVGANSDMPRWTSVRDGQMYVFVPDTAANREVIARQVDPDTGAPYENERLESFAQIDPFLDPEVNPVGNRVIRTWPYAIRITVRVWDPRGRLDEPIVRTLVHRFE